jgi:hypothetical protein
MDPRDHHAYIQGIVVSLIEVVGLIKHVQLIYANELLLVILMRKDVEVISS